jgi:CRISPR-associated endonuclease Csn1
MGTTLGLDIGSNSVGSAWVDTDKKEIVMGVSVFPAGVDETDTKRGSPKNQRRREKRSQRRSLARRAARKRRLRELLTSANLLPADAVAWKALVEKNPWVLRRKALTESLTPHEFGRILIHLGQRRGAWGVQTDPEDPEEGKVKEAIDHLTAAMKESKAETFGQFIADRMDERRHPVPGKCNLAQPPAYCPPKCGSQNENCRFYCDAVRNRRDAFEFHATRDLIQKEFERLWETQKKLGGELAGLLTKELKEQLNNPKADDTWRQRGVLFGQRKTYWNLGTLGRCDLEPSDRCCPIADMHAQEFRVLETVNNIRISEYGREARALTDVERASVKKALQSQKTGSVPAVRKALGIDTASLKRKNLPHKFRLNLEADKDREINTDWFYREIVRAVFGEDAWLKMDEAKRESVNRAVLKFDPDSTAETERLRSGAIQWWGLAPEAADKFMQAWKTRPKLEKRLNLSRRAILNILPYMRQWGCGVIEARQLFAEDGENGASKEQRERYALGGSGLTKADRHFLRKHPNWLPPAPMLANPVVRKAIHEVRRHVIAYIRKFGRMPDRIVIELAREAKQTEKVRNKILAANRTREKERKQIILDFGLAGLPPHQQQAAVDRVILCRQQGSPAVCPYSDLVPGNTGKVITEGQAAKGTDVEIDHIVPLSRSQDNSLNNKVLCYRQANRGKRNLTPKEWLTAEQFSLLEQRMRHWEKDLRRKWENLHRAPLPEQEFLNSQLTATAYAAAQVGAYLSDSLYGGERDGRRRVFFTKGTYTAMLRKDWQLFQALKADGEGAAENGTADPQKRADPGNKNRGDHRHHAIDATVIALTGPEIIMDVARLAAEREEYHERTGHWPRREPLPPPWGTTDEFRRQALSQLFDVFDKANLDGTRSEGAETGTPLVVSHRPVKRKVIGYLHKEDIWGAVDEEEGVFRIRCPIADLNPKMLRMPEPETDDQVRQRLIRESEHAGMTNSAARKAATNRMRLGDFKRLLVDPSLGKGGLVRDWDLRRVIRECLKNNGIDPDHFTDKQMQEFAKTGSLRMPNDGVPIRAVITIGPISDPVKIAVRDPTTRRQAVNSRTGKLLFRYHISRNNHHVEIMQDAVTGGWSARNGKCVTMYEAAQRIRPPKDPDGGRPQSQQAVNREDAAGQTFVTSLSEGETVFARRWDPASNQAVGSSNYFVVVKLDSNRIFFAPHWDARSEREQDRWAVTYSDLKHCGPVKDAPPCKVRVDPLGQVRPLHHD